MENVNDIEGLIKNLKVKKSLKEERFKKIVEESIDFSESKEIYKPGRGQKKLYSDIYFEGKREPYYKDEMDYGKFVPDYKYTASILAEKF